MKERDGEEKRDKGERRLSIYANYYEEPDNQVISQIDYVYWKENAVLLFAHSACGSR